jgi:hypothetical protein
LITQANIPKTKVIYKTADEYRNNTTTLEADDHLTMDFSKGVYEVEFNLRPLHASSATPQFKWKVNISGGTSSASPILQQAPTTTTGESVTDTTMTVYASDAAYGKGCGVPISNDGITVYIKFLLIVTAGTTTVYLSWAQNNADVSNTELSQYSFMKGTKLDVGGF